MQNQEDTKLKISEILKEINIKNIDKINQDLSYKLLNTPVVKDFEKAVSQVIPKKCLSFNNHKCGKIINSHSIQAKQLELLRKNSQLLCFKSIKHSYKTKKPLRLKSTENASIFKAFCAEQDRTLFDLIDTTKIHLNKNSIKQIILRVMSHALANKNQYLDYYIVYQDFLEYVMYEDIETLRQKNTKVKPKY